MLYKIKKNILYSVRKASVLEEEKIICHQAISLLPLLLLFASFVDLLRTI